MFVTMTLLVCVVRAEITYLGPPVVNQDPLRLGKTQAQGGLQGTVVAVGPQSILIHGKGETFGGPNGVQKIQGIHQLRAWGPLALGLPVDGGLMCHHLSEVRHGDRVRATIGRIDDRWVIVRVLIDRRPGGKIPPVQHDLRAWKLHEMFQLQQDTEEGRLPPVTGPKK